MIFVTVGTHPKGFPRLVKKMDEIAEKLDEEVMMQMGYTNYKPRKARFFNFVSFQEIQKLNQLARIVITHDGAGSIIVALQSAKPTIVVPRMKKYGECNYDNKAELAVELEKEGLLKVVYNVNDLEKIMKEIPVNYLKSKDKGIAFKLRAYIGIE